MMNPFDAPNTFHPQKFVGRHLLLKEIRSHLIAGNSIALVGEPSMGKTWLLRYLEVLYPPLPNTEFVYIDLKDAPLFSSQVEYFWQIILDKLHALRIIDARHARFPKEEAGRRAVLHKIIVGLREHKKRLVLLIDPIPGIEDGSAPVPDELMRTIRLVVSDHRKLVSLIIAVERDLDMLFPDWSWVRSIPSLVSIHLQPFALPESQQLLANERFDDEDKDFLWRLSGGHPYLLRAGASLLWKAYQAGELSCEERWRYTTDRLGTDVLNKLMNRLWQGWTQNRRLVLQLLAVDPLLSPDRHRDEMDFRNEVVRLSRLGYVEIKGSPYGEASLRSEAIRAWLLENKDDELHSSKERLYETTTHSNTLNRKRGVVSWGPDDDAGKEVAFTAYHPKEGGTNQWYPLVVYTHLLDSYDKVRRDVARFSDELEAPKEITFTASTPLARGTEITIVPFCESITFNPMQVTFKWLEDYQRALFRFSAGQELAGDAAKGHITVYAGPLMIGTLKFAMLFDDHNSGNLGVREEQARMYRKDEIFISYSHKDTEIAILFKKILEATGYDVMMDIDDLRSGQIWNDELMRMIERARVFQLFWSENASQSKYCEQEWRHALKQNRETGYIRPVYWKKPIPNPPEELSKFHFDYIELRDPIP